MVTQLASPVTFTAGTTIVSDDVDANFAAIRSTFNDLVTPGLLGRSERFLEISVLKSEKPSSGSCLRSSLIFPL